MSNPWSAVPATLPWGKADNEWMFFASEKAWHIMGERGGVQAAMEWLLEHNEDPDIDVPYKPPDGHVLGKSDGSDTGMQLCWNRWSDSWDRKRCHDDPVLLWLSHWGDNDTFVTNFMWHRYRAWHVRNMMLFSVASAAVLYKFLSLLEASNLQVKLPSSKLFCEWCQLFYRNKESNKRAYLSYYLFVVLWNVHLW